jgi:hypothetical protein
MTQFECKEPGCPLKVHYQREEIPGARMWRNRSDETVLTKTVYLTCDNGHTFPYRVTP